MFFQRAILYGFKEPKWHFEKQHE